MSEGITEFTTDDSGNPSTTRLVRNKTENVTALKVFVTERIKDGRCQFSSNFSERIWFIHCLIVDISMAIMLDHSSTALGRDFNSQVLKHWEFGDYNFEF